MLPSGLGHEDVTTGAVLIITAFDGFGFLICNLMCFNHIKLEQFNLGFSVVLLMMVPTQENLWRYLSQIMMKKVAKNNKLMDIL